tara:strand:- start:165 stop:413 length:249 start_codon:yes stop_codon:yes gene_type:complete
MMSIVLNDGSQFEGATAFDIIAQLKVLDWALPSSIEDFKHNVVERTLVMGHLILYWDATSFLYGMESAGLLVIIRKKKGVTV